MEKIENRILGKRYLYDGKKPWYFSKTRKNKIDEFESKKSLKSKKVKPCYLCQKTDFIRVGEKDKYGFYYPVLLCKNCSLVQTNPYYTNEEVGLFYGDYFREIYMGTRQTQKYIYKNNIKRGEGIIDFLETHINEKIVSKRVLDIGCGNGGILKAFKNKGNECLGIDLGASYFNQGLDEGLDLRQKSLEGLLVDKTIEKFDVVVFSHNLEHLINPLDELSLLEKIIHKDTIIFISVPGIFFMDNNNFDYVGEYFQNAHKSHFSLSTLVSVMNVSGYELVYGDEEIQSIFKLSESNKHFEDVNPEEVYNKMLLIESKYKKSFYKILFIKTTYLILDKLGLRIAFLSFLQKIGITRILRKILLSDNEK